MATRILAAWYLLGQDSDYPAVNFNAWNGGGSHVNVQADHATYVHILSLIQPELKTNDTIMKFDSPNRSCVCCAAEKYE